MREIAVIAGLVCNSGFKPDDSSLQSVRAGLDQRFLIPYIRSAWNLRWILVWQLLAIMAVEFLLNPFT